MGIGYPRNIAQFGVTGAVGFLALGKRNLFWFFHIISFLSTAMFGGRAAAFVGVVVPYFIAWSVVIGRLKSKTATSSFASAVLFLVSVEYFKYGGRAPEYAFQSVLQS
jgi:exosortase/archaeosortase